MVSVPIIDEAYIYNKAGVKINQTIPARSPNTYGGNIWQNIVDNKYTVGYFDSLYTADNGTKIYLPNVYSSYYRYSNLNHNYGYYVNVVITARSSKLSGSLNSVQQAKLTAKGINPDNITTATSGYMYVGTP